MKQKNAIRLLVFALTVVVVVLTACISLPQKSVSGETRVDLPDVALGQEAVYRAEIFVLLFYGGLLVLTPIFRGVILGRLPIEVSARGAKFAEEVDESLATTQGLVADQQSQLESLETQALRTRLNIAQLASSAGVALED